MSNDLFDAPKTPGINWFQREPGTVDSLRCPTCGSECVVKRNVYRESSYAVCMMNAAGWHDEFICPNNKEDWHWKAERFVSEMGRTNSKQLSKLIFQDLLDYLKEQGVTYQEVGQLH